MNKKLGNINLREIYSKWMEGSGAFRCFFRAINFVSLKHYPDFVLSDVSLEEDSLSQKITEIINKVDFSRTILLLELNGAEAIKQGYVLQNFHNIKSILTFNGSMHSYGLIGGKEYISALLIYGEHIKQISPKGYAFIVDSQRYGDYSKEDMQRFFNNQYELTDEDLPSSEMLKELGYDRVMYIYSDEIKEDMCNYLKYLSEEGIAVLKEGEDNDKGRIG